MFCQIPHTEYMPPIVTGTVTFEFLLDNDFDIVDDVFRHFNKLNKFKKITSAGNVRRKSEQELFKASAEYASWLWMYSRKQFR
jgi:hypothetical protein